MENELSVFVGYQSTAPEAFEICKFSIEKYASRPIQVFPLKQDELRQRALYTRPVDQKASNEFNMTRWLTPFLSKTPYAIFMDCDMILTGDIHRVLEGIDPAKAVHVVKHDYVPKCSTKMAVGGAVQVQHAYPRKNWSSFVLWNCKHPAVQQVTPQLIDFCEPAYVHRFQFLSDDQIGGFAWWTTAFDGAQQVRTPLINFLVGEYPKPAELPLVIHFTLGMPVIHDHCNACDYYKEWMDLRAEMKLGQKIARLEETLRNNPTLGNKAA
jgi:hypothetical protein